MTVLATPTRNLVLAVIAVLGVASCGGEQATDAAGPPPEDAAPTAEAVEVTLVDYDFVGLPDAVPAGTRVTVSNEAEAELHELVAFRLADDDERPLDEIAQLPPEEIEQALGAPVAVLLAEPGGEQIAAVGDGTLSEAGRYAIMCFIPTGADPEEYLGAAAASEGGPPEVAGGPPHFVHGMFQELDVG